MKIQNAIAKVIPIFNSFIIMVKFVINPIVSSEYTKTMLNNLIGNDLFENENDFHDNFKHNIEPIIRCDNKN
jgi:hypothetical protein